ncbi:MAG: hypothetical protein PHQ40_15065 [Anaerolineaceae bacterium]|nr:hypothetical protein [Anaerolineaceae bacterium]
MGKNSQYARPNELQLEYEKSKKDNPIWRGIGFILMIVIPILAYMATQYILDQNREKNWFPLPADIISPWGNDPLIFIKILITVSITIVAFMVIFLVGSLLARVFGPPRYGPLDSPPVTREDIERSAVHRRPR